MKPTETRSDTRPATCEGNCFCRCNGSCSGKAIHELKHRKLADVLKDFGAEVPDGGEVQISLTATATGQTIPAHSVIVSEDWFNRVLVALPKLSHAIDIMQRPHGKPQWEFANRMQAEAKNLLREAKA